MPAPPHDGLSHVALSVTDLAASTAWYGRVLELRPLFAFSTDDFDRQLLRHASGLVVALTQHRTTGDGRFDPTVVGLDHLSLRVADVDGLMRWCAHLDELGVRHGGVQTDPTLGSALVAFTDPDGVQLELYLQASAPPPPA